MYKVYFKQAVELLKQNMFISVISIAGTALAIMMVMILIVVDQVKNADVAPESNRSELLYISYRTATGKGSNKSKTSGILQYEQAELLKKEVQSASIIAITNGVMMDFAGQTVRFSNEKLRTPLDVRATDANYWDIVSLGFIEGKPYSEAEFKSGIRSAVISQDVAEEFLGKESAIGKTLEIENKEYKIIGVVHSVSKAFNYAYAKVWIPYTSLSSYENGAYDVVMLTDRSKVKDLEKEVRNIEEKYNKTNSSWDLKYHGPKNHRLYQISMWDSDKNIEIQNRRRIFLFSILLLIPAINLSSLSLSRVRRRMEEIGVRKAFGAKKGVILIQILYENFITSLLGGIIGIILSFLIVSLMKEWLLGATDSTSLPLDALISVHVLVAVVVVSFILNLLSSGIPAWSAASMNIVESLNRKK